MSLTVSNCLNSENPQNWGTVCRDQIWKCGHAYKVSKYVERVFEPNRNRRKRIQLTSLDVQHASQVPCCAEPNALKFEKMEISKMIWMSVRDLVQSEGASKSVFALKKKRLDTVMYQLNKV